jgi:hypothetical protein
MPDPVASILRAATRRQGEPLNILTAPTHERFETNLARTGHRFWAVRNSRVKDWNTDFAPVPDNYVLLNPEKGDYQLPPEVDFDLVLSQNKFGQFQLLAPVAKSLHLPLVSLEHTLPHTSWPAGATQQLKGLRGDVNVFISEYSRKAWGWDESEAKVVRHGVDTEVFWPGRKCSWFADSHVLSVVNEFNNPERFWCCGYPFWQEATRGLPTKHFGSSKDGWSKPAATTAELVEAYRRCAVFVDTAMASPIPSVVLEAMACGCVVVSYGNAMVSEVIEDGVNGFIRKDPESMREQLRAVLDRPEDFLEVRMAAARTVAERFPLSRFVASWDSLLRSAADLTYVG